MESLYTKIQGTKDTLMLINGVHSAGQKAYEELAYIYLTEIKNYGNPSDFGYQIYLSVSEKQQYHITEKQAFCLAKYYHETIKNLLPKEEEEN